MNQTQILETLTDAALLASKEVAEWAEFGDGITRDEAYRIIYKHMNDMSLRYIELMKQIGD